MLLSSTFKNLMRCVSAMGDLKLLEKMDEEVQAAIGGENSLHHDAAEIAQAELDKYRAFIAVAIEMQKTGADKKEYFTVEILPSLE